MKSPPKETAALEDAPRLRPTSCGEANSRREFAQPCGELFVLPCGHRETRTVRMPKGYTHLAQERCAVCDRHVQWLPRPENIARRRLTAYCLAKLGMCVGLSKWEREFLRKVARQRRLSPRQQEIVDRLTVQYLEGATP